MAVSIVVAAIKCPHDKCRAKGINCLNCLRNGMKPDVDNITSGFYNSAYNEECIGALYTDLVEAFREVIEGDKLWSLTSFQVDESSLQEDPDVDSFLDDDFDDGYDYDDDPNSENYPF